jgi:hypothetical protein
MDGFTAKEAIKEGDYVTFAKDMGLRDGIVKKNADGYLEIVPSAPPQSSQG